MYYKNKSTLWVPVISGFLVFLFMLAQVLQSHGAPLPWDDTVRYWIYGLRCPALTNVLTAITYCGNWNTITGICLILLPLSFFWRPFGSSFRDAYGLSLSIAPLLSTFLYKTIKTLVLRPRPDIHLHLISQGGYSFPSGHAMTSLVFYGLLLFWVLRYLKQKKCGNAVVYCISTLFFCFIFLIGFSRIYVGVHYPSDVLAGWGAGTVILSAFYAFFIRKNNGLEKVN